MKAPGLPLGTYGVGLTTASFHKHLGMLGEFVTDMIAR